jgi:tetratricopeptide (TPR) repeat protein
MFYPNNIHVYNAKAIAYLDRAEFDKALECCQAGLKIKDYYWLRANKIEALIGLNRIDEAFEFYNSSDIPAYSFTEALINCGKYSEISKYGYELSEKELLDCLFKRCQYLDRKGNREEILKVCEEIFKLDKDNETALQYKIRSLAFLQRDEEVLKCSEYAIKLYPDNFRFYFEKAETLLWSFDDIDAAVECYEKGFSLAGDFDRFWHDIDNIVVALNKKADRAIESGDYKKAVDIYDKILFYKPREFKALDNIDALVGKHGVKYEPSEYYNESLKLRIELENRFCQIDEYLKAIDIGEYDPEYVNGCSEFKEYKTLSEYVRDIIICLMEAYPDYSEEDSKNRVKQAFDDVRESFELKEPAYDFAVVYGFSAG